MKGTRRNYGSIGLATFVVAAAMLVGCAAGDARFAADPAGFWHGLWHGIIAPVTLVVGIFSDATRMYEPHNTGGWYDFGFLVGVTSFWGAKHVHSRRRRCAPQDPKA